MAFFTSKSVRESPRPNIFIGKTFSMSLGFTWLNELWMRRGFSSFTDFDTFFNGLGLELRCDLIGSGFDVRIGAFTPCFVAKN